MFVECASLASRMRICMCVCVCTIVRACILAQRRNAAGFLGGLNTLLHRAAMEGQAASACAAPSGSEADRETHQGHTALEAGLVLPGLGECGSTDGDGCHDQVPDCPASEEQSGSGCAAQAGFAGEPTAFASAEAGSVGSTAKSPKDGHRRPLFPLADQPMARRKQSLMLSALNVDGVPLTRAERRASKGGVTGQPAVDSILNEVEALQRLRSSKATSIVGKWEHVLPQGRDAAGMVCSSKRKSRRVAGTDKELGFQSRQKLAYRLLGRREYIQSRWFGYWQLLCGPNYGNNFEIVEDDDGIPLFSCQEIRVHNTHAA